MNPLQFDLLLEERRRELAQSVETQRKQSLLAAPARPHPGRRCCAWIGVRLQKWGVWLQRYAAQGQGQAWKEQPL